jgi:hypothetical protein
VGNEHKLIKDYIVIPADISHSGKLELIISDPYGGFHICRSEEENISNWYENLEEL